MPMTLMVPRANTNITQWTSTNNLKLNSRGVQSMLGMMQDESWVK